MKNPSDSPSLKKKSSVIFYLQNESLVCLGTTVNLLIKVVYGSTFKGSIIGSLLVIRPFLNKMHIVFLFVLESIAIDIYINISISLHIYCMFT